MTPKNNDSASRKVRRLEALVPTGFTLIGTLVLWFMPEIDLGVSGLFFNPAQGKWPYEENPLVLFAFNYGPLLPILLFCSSLVVSILSLVWPYFFRYRAQALYITLVLLVIPTLLIHLVLKETWKRPRPRDTIEFQGTHTFHRILEINDDHFQGRSFPSGHAAAGFSMVVLYFLFKGKGRRSIIALIGTLLFGIWLSAARIMAGGHFLSDTLWAFFLCWFGAYLFYYYWFMPYSYKLNTQTPFTPSRLRRLVFAISLGLLLAGVALFHWIIQPYHQNLPHYHYPIPEGIQTVELKMRARKGDIGVQYHDEREIKVQIWAKGDGPSHLEMVYSPTLTTPNRTTLRLEINLAPSSWFWTYQSHTTLWVPRNLNIQWDLKTKLGSLFWPEDLAPAVGNTRSITLQRPQKESQ